MCADNIQQQPQKHPEEHSNVLIAVLLSFFFLGSKKMFLYFEGVSSDPALHPDLHPCWGHEAHHPLSPESSTAPVWSEKL